MSKQISTDAESVNTNYPLFKSSSLYIPPLNTSKLKSETQIP